MRAFLSVVEVLFGQPGFRERDGVRLRDPFLDLDDGVRARDPVLDLDDGVRARDAVLDLDDGVRARPRDDTVLDLDDGVWERPDLERVRDATDPRELDGMRARPRDAVPDRTHLAYFLTPLPIDCSRYMRLSFPFRSWCGSSSKHGAEG